MSAVTFSMHGLSSSSADVITPSSRVLTAWKARRILGIIYAVWRSIATDSMKNQDSDSVPEKVCTICSESRSPNQLLVLVKFQRASVAYVATGASSR